MTPHTSEVDQDHRHGPALSAGMTSPDELMRSVNEFRRLLDSIGTWGMSVAADLVQLDRLVRRYPEAARKSLQLYDGKRLTGRRTEFPGNE